MTGPLTGIELSRRLHAEAVGPLLADRLPGLGYAAALVGRGSDVLGYDDETSRDHAWGARLTVFVEEDESRRAAVEGALGTLPATFEGWPTHVPVTSVRRFLLDQLGVDGVDGLRPRDWFTFPEQALLMVTGGAVHHDEVGLQDARDALAYYPRDVWLYLMAAAWWRVHPEANSAGRAGSAGDDLGSALVAARLVHDLIALCFLLERRYAPYAKWFGTAFRRLPCGPDLLPVLSRVLRATSWEDREEALIAAYEAVADVHAARAITPPVTTEVIRPWGRPLRAAVGDFPEALLARVEDPEVLRLAERWPVGGVESLRDQPWDVPTRRALLALFD